MKIFKDKELADTLEEQEKRELYFELIHRLSLFLLPIILMIFLIIMHLLAQ